jgi:hypothetical protein
MRILVIGAIGIALLAGIAIGQHTNRFEYIYREDVQGTYGGPSGFTVFHDKTTGQEIVCIMASTSITGTSSCYLTGRKWGGEAK